LDEIGEIHQHVRSGEVEEAETAISKVREQVLADSIKPQFVAYLDFEASCQIQEAQRQRRYKNQSIPLIEKIVDDTVGGVCGVSVIPGPRAEKCYNFFLYYGYGMFVEDWKKALTAHGYNGSVLIYTYNHPSGFDVARTGQLHGLFLDDHIGMSEKGWWIDGLQDDLENFGSGRLPQFIWGSSYDKYFVEEFGEFLQENFPLK